MTVDTELTLDVLSLRFAVDAAVGAMVKASPGYAAALRESLAAMKGGIEGAGLDSELTALLLERTDQLVSTWLSVGE